MKQLKQKDLKKIRKVYHDKQNGICPILNKKVPFDETVVDHLHKKSAKSLHLEKGGNIRGVIHRVSNSLEGKITNNFIRYGLHKMDITIPEFLRNLADYLENSPLLSLNLIHPSEAPKIKKLSKRSFMKLKKLHDVKYPNRKPIEYPKSKKITKKLRSLFNEFSIEPEFLKGK